MPTYDYVCDECGDHFEAFQPITAPPLAKCPKCQGHARRLISAGNGFLFKGSGFYITDYRNENYQKDKQKSEGSIASSDNGKSTLKSENESKSKTLAQNTVKKAD